MVGHVLTGKPTVLKNICGVCFCWRLSLSTRPVCHGYLFFCNSKLVRALNPFLFAEAAVAGQNRSVCSLTKSRRTTVRFVRIEPFNRTQKAVRWRSFRNPATFAHVSILFLATSQWPPIGLINPWGTGAGESQATKAGNRETRYQEKTREPGKRENLGTAGAKNEGKPGNRNVKREFQTRTETPLPHLVPQTTPTYCRDEMPRKEKACTL